MSEKQQRELANIEFALLGTKREVDDLQLQILEFRIKKIRIKIELEKLQQQVLQEVFTRIKQSSIRISEADVAFAKDELEKNAKSLMLLKLIPTSQKRRNFNNVLPNLKRVWNC